MAYSPIYKVKLAKTDQDITDKVTKLHYEDCTEEDDLVTITLEKLSNDWIDSKEVNKGAEIHFAYGFQGVGMSGTRIGVIKDFEVDYGEQISGTITALDQGYLFKKLTSNRIYKDLTTSEIITQIANQFNLPCEVEQTTEKHKAQPMGNKTYWQFLQKLTARAGSTDSKKGTFKLFFRSGKLYFKQKDSGKPAKRSFTYGKGDGVVISFKPKFTEKDSDTAGATVAGIDPETNTPYVASADAKHTEEVKHGEEQAHFSVDGVENQTGYSFPDPDGGKFNIGTMKMKVGNSNTYAESKVEVKAKQSKGAETELTATLTIQGDVSMEADQIITMLGVAKKHAGNWYVTKVIQDVGDSGFTTEIELNKTGTKKSASETKQKNSDVNKTKGDEKADKSKEVEQVHYTTEGFNKKGGGAGGSW